MLIRFNEMKETTISEMNGGLGTISAKMHMEPSNKIMISRLPAGSSIGTHRHTTSCEVNYVLSGTGKAICDGIEETLYGGVCQYCPKGSDHSIINTGNVELVLFTVVPEQ